MEKEHQASPQHPRQGDNWIESPISQAEHSRESAGAAGLQASSPQAVPPQAQSKSRHKGNPASSKEREQPGASTLEEEEGSSSLAEASVPQDRRDVAGQGDNNVQAAAITGHRPSSGALGGAEKGLKRMTEAERLLTLWAGDKCVS